MKKKWNLIMVCICICGMMQITGCGKESKPEANPQATVDSAQVQLEEFEYEDYRKYWNYRGDGIMLTKYNGEGGDVEIPEEIDGETVLGIEKNTFVDCKSLTSITIPLSVEIQEDTFSKFPDVILKGYRNTPVQSYAFSNNLAFQMLDDKNMYVTYVELYDVESDKCTVLHAGDSGVDGEYSEGASFSVKDGEAVLTLDGYNGGMIRTNEYGSLIIRLAEGSVNNVNAAKNHVGISMYGNLTMEGNGSLSIAGGKISRGSEEGGGGMNGIEINGDLTIRDRVKLFVKSGTAKVEPNYVLLVKNGNITITNSYVEAAAGTTGIQCKAIMAWTDMSGEYGQILLDNVDVVAGGAVAEVQYEQEEGELVVGHAISEEAVVRVIDMEYGEVENAAEYVRIEPSH